MSRMIGHNSVQIHHDGKFQTPEQFHRSSMRAERNRLIRKGHIIPPYAMPPQLMVKLPDGRWVPEIKTFDHEQL